MLLHKHKTLYHLFDGLPSSSYAVIDSGYKQMYDKYNDVFRFVPLNGDIAGLCARTDNVADPHFSPELQPEVRLEVQYNSLLIQIKDKEMSYIKQGLILLLLSWTRHNLVW